MQNWNHVTSTMGAETGVPVQVLHGGAAANSIDKALAEEFLLHERLPALMLYRAARRQGAATLSTPVGVALVALAHWTGSGAAIVPYFVVLSLLFVVYNQVVARRIVRLRCEPLQALEYESRFVLGQVAAGAAWGLNGWMVPDMNLVVWTASDVLACLIMVYVSCVLLITLAHCPRALVASICAIWLVSIMPVLFQREEMSKSLIIIAGVLGLLATTMIFGRMLIRQTRRGVLAELQREDLTESLRVANLGLEQALRSAVEAASHDPLTGALNRRALYTRAQQIAAERRRHEGPCAVLLLDLDHFKRVNDRHGHAAGDAVLAALAATLRGALREIDVIARWGGEEFLVLLPDCDMAAALARAEQVRAEVSRMDVGVLPPGYPLRVSIGAAAWPQDQTLDYSIGRADQALYAAKDAGRDRVVQAA